MAKKKRPSKHSKPSSLKSGRPPLSRPSTSNTKLPSLSSKHTRTLINTHHLLQKRLATARLTGDVAKVAEIEAQLAAQGGLESYQLASRTGQRNDRGGDSSKVLVKWLEGEVQARKAALRGSRSIGEREDVDNSKQVTLVEGMKPKPIRILEVGALSTQNALNIAGITTVRRIDLRSPEQGIEEIDFMDLPIPAAPNGEADSGYDVLSLSLVLNYVPDPEARGEMLKRTTQFFNTPTSTRLQREQSSSDEEDQTRVLPCLFLVLPSPCLHNSRYLDAERLTSILNSLGYSHLHSKTTRKLYYSLWRYDDQHARDQWVMSGGQTVFKKTELKPGGGRNNFCIVLETE
ncbi:25S rRNA (adenine2142-N1)-methyltransferase [Cladophialophora chaetospira]|uniref:25S rRNA adenine-N(1) methyltransferase n=1 Tax=Cladophialophora chaetospira TaxID=386627 RepID=A0AA38WZ50_9EURO|nr:25S rRNA (adenine2142-N1)-methyltransferase [Cladophialophora chaetospira]